MGKDKKREKKSKKHKHKHKKSKRKHRKHEKDPTEIKTNNQPKQVVVVDNQESGFEIPLELMNTKSHTPVTPEEFQQRQNQLRRVVDPSTGRTRLIRGEGEVLEEIVTKEQHAKINNLATTTDGAIFQKNTIGSLKKGN